MARLAGKPGFDGTEFHSLMALRPEIEKPWYALSESVKFEGLLDSRLKEEVRRVIATRGGCAYCASLGKPASDLGDAKLQAAVEFTHRVCDDPAHIDDESWRRVSAHFTAAELVELSVWICFMYGSNMFGAIMKVSPASEKGVQEYCDWFDARAAKSTPAAAPRN